MDGLYMVQYHHHNTWNTINRSTYCYLNINFNSVNGYFIGLYCWVQLLYVLIDVSVRAMELSTELTGLITANNYPLVYDITSSYDQSKRALRWVWIREVALTMPFQPRLISPYIGQWWNYSIGQWWNYSIGQWWNYSPYINHCRTTSDHRWSIQWHHQRHIYSSKHWCQEKYRKSIHYTLSDNESQEFAIAVVVVSRDLWNQRSNFNRYWIFLGIVQVIFGHWVMSDG